jgi:hypothetical protein
MAQFEFRLEWGVEPGSQTDHGAFNIKDKTEASGEISLRRRQTGQPSGLFWPFPRKRDAGMKFV